MNNIHCKRIISLVFLLLMLIACSNSGNGRLSFIDDEISIDIEENTQDISYVALTNARLLRELNFSVTGGADQERFSINPFTGELSFDSPRDFEAPADSDSNNTYIVEISVTDDINTAMQMVRVTVTDEFDFQVVSTDVKSIEFVWAAFSDATFYRLLVNPDGISGFTTLQDNIIDTRQSITVPVHLTNWVNARYMLEAHNSTGLLNTTSAIAISQAMLTVIGYFKASNTNARDEFGGAISLSGDGTTLAVGAPFEKSDATGVNPADPAQADNSAFRAGAVYIFTRSGISWHQQAYIKASNTDANDQFGSAVSLSSDGATLAVGASGKHSNTTDINAPDPAQADNSTPGASAVYIFTRSDVSWSQQAYIKASNTDANDRFGSAVSLSSDGATLAVGAYGEDSDAKDINAADPAQEDNSAERAGAVYVFTRSGISWSQQAYIKASNTDKGDQFGGAVSLSSDGATLAVGAEREESNAIGINAADPAQEDNTESDAGAVYVFTRSSSSWSQQAYIKASNTNAGDFFGGAVSLSSDGATLAVGAEREETGVNPADPAQTENTAENAGAVYVFTRSGISWSQQAYIKASNTDANDQFGGAVSLSSDGTTLAVGARLEDSNARNINAADPVQTENTAENAGAVYVFTRSDVSWHQQAYIKASNTDALDSFGSAVSLSSDGTTLAVGADGEDSNAKDINAADPAQADNSASVAGAVYIY